MRGLFRGGTEEADGKLDVQGEVPPAPAEDQPEPQIPGVLESVTNRRSVFPRDYVDAEVPATVVQSMLDAAAWAPFHGPTPPWRFVVLGKSAMVEMQQLSLDFYDKNWQETGWADGSYYFNSVRTHQAPRCARE